MGLSLSENKVINIVETAGVANGSFEHQDVISRIFKWLQDRYISVYNDYTPREGGDDGYIGTKRMYLGNYNYYKCDVYQFSIPQEITNKFQWLKNIIFVCIIEDFKVWDKSVQYYDPGGGSYAYMSNNNDTISVLDHYKDNILEGAYIDITFKSCKGKIDHRTFDLILQHELNHLYSEKQKLSKLNINNPQDIEKYENNC
jgi:hypothetical protein